MNGESGPPVKRPDRRKERTRGALIAAAQRLLAAGATSVSIQEITDSADVGFGSFYNHFASKDELFAAAVAATLDAWARVRDNVVAGIEDPAEVFAVSYRMTGRLQRVQPELVRVLLNSGTAFLQSDRGLRPRALADLAAGMAAGRYTVSDPELAFMVAGGALLGLLQMLEGQPELDGDATSDAFAQRVLVMLGVSEEEARRLCALPLPLMPPIPPVNA